MIGHQPLELFTSVLATAVRVMQQSIRFASSPDRHHHQGIGDELGLLIAAFIDQPTTRRENRSTTAAT